MRLPRPRFTLWLVGFTVFAWVAAAVLGIDAKLAYAAGFIPARFGGLTIAGAVPAWLTPLSATLLHGGLLHLGFNMLMLGYCGRSVEFALGARGAVLVYLAGAYAAALAQYLWAPSGLVPMVGASGAISATVGAYALLFGDRARPATGGRFSHSLQAVRLAAGWIFVQLLIGIASMGSGVSIAVAAHVGGFLIGLVLARPLLRWRYRQA